MKNNKINIICKSTLFILLLCFCNTSNVIKSNKQEVKLGYIIIIYSNVVAIDKRYLLNLKNQIEFIEKIKIFLCVNSNINLLTDEYISSINKKKISCGFHKGQKSISHDNVTIFGCITDNNDPLFYGLQIDLYDYGCIAFKIIEHSGNSPSIKIGTYKIERSIVKTLYKFIPMEKCE